MTTIDYLHARGWLTIRERHALKHYASMLKSPARLLNIGVEYGASLYCLAAGKPTAQIVGVDIDLDKFVDSPDLPPLEMIRRSSADLVKSWRKLIDLLFIDGDHTFEGVTADLGFVKRVSVGGFVLVHDCYLDDGTLAPHPSAPEVDQALTVWLDKKRNSKRLRELPAVDSLRVFEVMQ